MDNLKILYNQLWDHKCLNSVIAKTHGRDYVKPKPLTDKTEKGIMECIEWHCYLNKVGMFWRTPNKSSKVGVKKNTSSTTEEIISGIGVTKDKPIWGYSSATDGLSDMAGFILVKVLSGTYPISIALEIKIPGDYQKKNQKDFAQNIRDSGGWYCIVQDFTEFLGMIEMIKSSYLKPV